MFAGVFFAPRSARLLIVFRETPIAYRDFPIAFRDFPLVLWAFLRIFAMYLKTTPL